jgi:hypothetical protein
MARPYISSGAAARASESYSERATLATLQGYALSESAR